MAQAVSRPGARAARQRRDRRGRPATSQTPEASPDLQRAIELATLVESAGDAVLGVSPRGLITHWGEGAQRLFGYSQAEAVGKLITMLAPPDRGGEAGAIGQQVSSGERVKRIETQRLTKDGRLLEVELSVSPIWSEDGRYMGSVGIMRDLTKLRQTLDELHSARLEDLERLALVGEYRDDDTNRHTERVARTASLVAIALGLDADLVRTIRRASPLHDIGKIGIPDCILLKPDRLTTEEFEVIKTHTAIGKRILGDSHFPILKMATEIAFTHHERWDGTGYPAGLRGPAIPICGRITALADAFDAMTHARPYKQAFSVEHAVAEIRRCSASQFDPAIVEAFMTLVHHELVDTVAGAGGRYAGALI
jgi:PAS domain S-box-containing protein